MKQKDLPVKPLNIILADDDSDDAYLFEKTMEEIRIHARLTVVQDGELLLRYLNSCNKTELPEVIFLDLNMPRMKGDECLVELKKDDTLKDIPVVIYSTAFLPEVADALYEKGASYYLQKSSYPMQNYNVAKAIVLVMHDTIRPLRNMFHVNDRQIRNW